MENRNQVIDLVKGICIILVVACHTITFSVFPPVLEKLCSWFFLRGFFMVSGYLYYHVRKEDAYLLCKKKFIKCAKPYMVFSLYAIIYQGVLAVCFHCREMSDTYFGWDIVKRDIYCTVSGIGIGTLWFLPVLFLSYALLVLLTHAYPKENNVQIAVFLITAILFEMLSRWLGTVTCGMDGLGGEAVDKYILMCHRISYGFAYSVIGCLFHQVLDMKKGKRYGSDWVGKFFAPITYCGRNSMNIMIYHYIFLLPAELMILKSLAFYQAMPEMFRGFLLFVINMSTTVLLNEIIKKIFRFMEKYIDSFREQIEKL